MSADTARLFFALWPAPEVQRALGDVAMAGTAVNAVAARCPRAKSISRWCFWEIFREIAQQCSRPLRPQ
jgi:hypothetical protein